MFSENHGILHAILLTALSGVPGLLTKSQSRSGQWLATVMMMVAGLLGLVGSVAVLRGAAGGEFFRIPLPIPGAEFVLSIDGLSAFFLAPILLVTCLGSVYSIDYWRPSDHLEDNQRMRLFYGFLTASLSILVLAGNSITFLISWECMAVSAFFLVGTQDQNQEVREAAWLYLGASHVATLTLFAMFALLYSATGNFELAPKNFENLSRTLANVVFVLALIGFGLKAGLMPLHFWLPSAHAMAPSHVSAVMSGVLIKTGIYGLVRITGLLPEPPLWHGILLLVLGAISAVLGVAFALGQHDIKRLLAYHSIENIGIIVIGLGLAVVGRTLQQEAWIILGFAGCILHVWNHALFKSLLFLSAGCVIHSRGTREIDRMGGLAKSMPWTSGCFLLGAAAICGLPPLNGFVSEFLIYLGLFKTLGLQNEFGMPVIAFLVPVLALMGALAVACFVKVFGVVFLGVNRSPVEHPSHEAPWTMLVPMGVIGLCCLAIGLGANLIVPVVDRSLAVWTVEPTIGSSGILATAPLSNLSGLAIGLFFALIVVAVGLRWRIQSQPVTWTETWGCGYTGPTPRMQYTASSLAQMLVSMLAWPLRTEVHSTPTKGLFPKTSSYHSYVPEVVLERGILPMVRSVAKVLFWFRLMQQGSVHIYILYIFSILVLLLLI